MLSKKDFICLAPEVQAALETGQPVVALESTIIAHGLPYPKNIETAIELEDIVRNEGAIPATIAVANGKIHIGLNRDLLATLGDPTVKTVKLSKKDLPYALVTKSIGATTVAATMFCANLAGIKIFATGGIGGVHKGAESSFDISADLEAIANIPVAVFCAGAKSILDIGKTLEMLETLGVLVVGFKCWEFPSFYCQNSGFYLDASVNDCCLVAKIIATNEALNLKSGIVVANPIPKKYELDKNEIDKLIVEATDLAKSENILGKNLTPFLLSYLNKNSGTKCLQANIALVKNNAKLAAQVAIELCVLRSDEARIINY